MLPAIQKMHVFDVVEMRKLTWMSLVTHLVKRLVLSEVTHPIVWY